MITLTDKILIGSAGEYRRALSDGVGAFLNVAQDLAGIYSWPRVEYVQVGLMDGPGNPPSTYCSAVLMLYALLSRHNKVMVYCHSGGRSLAVAMIYLIVKRGKTSGYPTYINHWTTWGKMLAELQQQFSDLPVPNEAHGRVFDVMPLSLLDQIMQAD